MDDRPYTKTDLMICVAARLFQDATTAFIGTGIPMLAAALATKTVAPNLVPVFEFGGPCDSGKLPRAVGESRTFTKGWWLLGSATRWRRPTRLYDYGFWRGAD